MSGKVVSGKLSSINPRVATRGVRESVRVAIQENRRSIRPCKPDEL